MFDSWLELKLNRALFTFYRIACMYDLTGYMNVIVVFFPVLLQLFKQVYIMIR